VIAVPCMFSGYAASSRIRLQDACNTNYREPRVWLWRLKNYAINIREDSAHKILIYVAFYITFPHTFSWKSVQSYG
jgi:hypothetical protein